jgi:RNA polymerase sigma-32 factor
MGDHDRWVDRAIRDQLERSNLTVERERTLLRLAQKGATPVQRRTALTELWESHSKLVIAVAQRYRRFNIDLLDLVGAGHLGLYTAIERFDLDRFAVRLSTYAAGWIRWSIQDYIRRNAGPVLLPSSAGHRLLTQHSTRLLADARKACLREGVAPTETELCERIGARIGLPPDDVACCLQVLQGGALSLHREAADAAGAPALEDTLADDRAISEDSTILRLDEAKLRNRIQALAQDVLGQRERIVFTARCLADSDDVVHLDDLAVRFGVSPERVYQLEASAKRKIVTALAREGYAHLIGEGGEIRLPQTRARRRRPAQPAAMPEDLDIAAAAD